MSKRKRSTSKETPPATPSEGSEGSPTVHVSSDMLAGSPDIWAPGKDMAVESEVASDVTPEDAAPPAEAQPESEESPSMAAVEPATAEDQPTEAVATETAVSAPPPPAYQPRPPAYVAPGSTTRRAGSSVAFGVVLVVLGLFALLIQFTGFDAGESWPLFVVIPGGVGLGLFLQGIRNRDPHLLRQGRVLMFVAAIIFMIGFVIFATIFRISDMDYGWFGKAALPALLIVVGLVLLARSIQRSRAA